MRWGKRIIVFSALIGAGLITPCQMAVSAEFEILAATRHIVRPTVDGLISRIAVREGDRVKTGQLLVELVNAEHKTRLKSLEAKLKRADADLEIVRRGATKEEKDRARQAVKTRQIAVSVQVQQCARTRRLVTQGVIPRAKLEDCMDELKQRQASYAEERARLGIALREATPAEIARAKADREVLLAEINALRTTIEAGMLRSRIDGVVITAQLEQKVGVRVMSGAEILQVADDTNLVAEIRVEQADLDVLLRGLPVELEVPSMPDKVFRGEVTSVAAAVVHDALAKTSYVPVRTKLINESGLLREGMRGDAKILLRESNVLAVLYRKIKRLLRADL